MPAEKRYVVDANVIVSALLLPDSTPRRAFDRASREGDVLLSAGIIGELDDVLRRPALNRYLSEEDRIHFLVRLLRESVVLPARPAAGQSRDPKDNKYLDLAAAGHATCIISGDKDLLVLNTFRGIPIITPRQFLESDL